MTVTTELYQSGWMPWTGVETTFVPGFSAAALDDVTVEFRNAALVVITLVRGVHYNATLGAGSNAYTATPIALPPAPGSLRFTRDTPALQPTNFANLSGFDAAVHTRLHDQAAMRDAELRGRVGAIEDGITPPPVPPLDPTTITHHLDTRTQITTTTFDGSVTWLKTAGCLAVGDGGHGVYKREGAQRPGGVQSVDGGWWNLCEAAPNFYQFGAAGTGAGNDYQAIADCIAYATAHGLEVHPGAGAFVMDMTGKATITLNSVRIAGTGLSEWMNSASPTTSGTWFLIKGITASPFTLGRAAGVSGCTFFYPDQVNPTVPIAYPVTLGGLGGGTPILCQITANLFVNAVSAIDLATGGFNTVRDNRFCCLGDAIVSTFSHAETAIINNFFSYGYGQSFYISLGVGSAFVTAYLARAIAIRCDGGNNAATDYSYDAWTIMGNTFFAQFKGLYGTKLGGESFVWGNVIGNHFDACQRGLDFENKCRPGILTVAGNTFNNQGNGTAATNLGHITIAPTGSIGFTVLITANLFGVSKGDHIVVQPVNPCDITISGNNFTGPGNGEVSAGCILLNNATTDATITGNNFSGVFQGGGINIDALVIQLARSVNFSMNMVKGCNVAVDNVGSAEKLSIIANNHLNLVTPVVAGTVTVKFRETLNSWNA